MHLGWGAPKHEGCKSEKYLNKELFWSIHFLFYIQVGLIGNKIAPPASSAAIYLPDK